MENLSNSINMSIRIDKDIKKEEDYLFENLGINTTAAITMFLKQCIRQQSFPFTPSMEKVPSERLLSALEEVEKIESGEIKAKRYKSFSDALKDLD